MMEATPRPSVAAVFDGMATWVVQGDSANYFGATKAEAEANARSHAEANALRGSHAALVAALEPFAAQYVYEDGACHVGICSMEECSRCSQILAARAALDAARNLEGER